MAFRSRVVSVPLALDLLLFSDAAGAGYKTLALDAPELDGLLPHADSLQLEWLLDQVGNGEIEWNILAYVGWNRDNELPSPVEFFNPASEPSNAGPQLASPSNFTSSNWRRHVRLVLRWRVKAGATPPKQAKFSAILHVTTKGS